MKTLEPDDRLAKKTTVSFPVEIIEEILSRLPVKSILRFRSVSKPWLSRISDPSFTKLHFTRATQSHRTALFISAYDESTRQLHLLTAPCHGGVATHLITLHDASSDHVPESEHLNGLVLYTLFKRVFVLNPSTRNISQLPVPDTSMDDSLMDSTHISYLFGFDESRNEHTILSINKTLETDTLEIMIFSMSTYSWKKIDVEPLLGFSWDLLNYDTHGSVCIDSVVHLMLLESPFDILAFDLRTEKFSIVNAPQGVLPHEEWNERHPYIIKINGCVGVVCYDLVEENNEMDVWILQDHVWVREIITFPTCWIALGRPFPLDAVNVDEIIFSSRELFGNVMSVHVYNRKSRRFRSLEFTLGPQIPLSTGVHFESIRCYVESMVPL